ncbi:hypothetical protein O3M35_004844 [Rhynocoris fuscipes]|uniref:ADP-ribosylation factor-like protein 2-binding protein n=1 Tax=Rhynocoris fuscipes TaxID=488301 RepID=A0AAW1DIC2_9HEMI
MSYQNGYFKMKDLNLEESFEDIDISCDTITSFDRTIGFIEDILVDDSFLEMQKHFLDKYCHEFNEAEENRLIYMEIFKLYVKMVEETLEAKLKEALPNFDMNKFYNELSDNRANLDGEVFDMLYTLSDFSAFKEMILEHKAQKEGRAIDASQDLWVTPVSFPERHFHQEN